MSVLKRSLGRVITAMITPFNEDGTVNYDGAVALAQQVDRRVLATALS